MSKLILALAALTLSLGPTAAAQVGYSGAAYPAEVGGVEIGRLPRYSLRKPFEAPKPKGEPKTGSRAGWTWVPGRWAVSPQPGMHWNAAHWGWQNESRSWIPGHWVRRPKGGLVCAGHPFP